MGDMNPWIHLDLKWEFVTSPHYKGTSGKCWAGGFSFVVYDISFVVYKKIGLDTTKEKKLLSTKENIIYYWSV